MIHLILNFRVMMMRFYLFILSGCGDFHLYVPLVCNIIRNYRILNYKKLELIYKKYLIGKKLKIQQIL